jgi:thymidylate synthase (FAD)
MADSSDISVTDKLRVLDKGFVRLDACEATDLSVVNSARVSFANRHEEMEEGDDKLIAFLMRERHGTPFEHNFFRFHVKAPIFIFREWQRHRIGSYNEWSARYSKLEYEFYVPQPENVRVQKGKPGAYTFEPAEKYIAQIADTEIGEAYEKAWESYEVMINAGIAKEVARIVLPVGIYSEMYWSVNARSLMNFLSLRNSPQALWEIRKYAEAIEYFFQLAMPITHLSFIRYDRKAP